MKLTYLFFLLTVGLHPCLSAQQTMFSGGDGDGGAVDTYSAAVSFPLTLLSFEATPTDRQVAITWQTENEVDTDHFILQRSPDGIHFTTFATLPAAGNAYGRRLTYAHSDASPLPGTSYYRLTTRDFDGSTSHSPIVEVTIDEAPAITYALYPNPVRQGQSLSIRSTHSSEPPTVDLFDQSGRQRLSSDTGLLDTATLPPGAYLLRLSVARNAPVSRLVIITD